MAVEVAERASVTAIERLRWLARYLSAIEASLLDDVMHFVVRANVVRQGDAAPPCLGQWLIQNDKLLKSLRLHLASGLLVVRDESNPADEREPAKGVP